MSNLRGIRRRQFSTLLLGSGALAAPASIWAQVARLGEQRLDEHRPDDSPRWQAVRRSLWGDRPIETAAAQRLQVNAPARAPDPAFVPVALRSPMGMDAGTDPSLQVRRLTLVIDQNPSPIAAVFDLPPDGALPDLETRVRVDEYSFVRGIAETADGRLWQALRFVKASGGCSAPAGGDEAALAARMGRIDRKSVV
jgi:sulfur-oxidizing protein SoxY